MIFPEPEALAPPILKLDDIQLSFGGTPLLDGAGLQVEPGDRICLVGRNGSGKSTLLKIAAGQIDLMAVLGLQPGASTSTIVGAVLDIGLKKLIEPGKDRVIDKLPSVIRGPVKPVLDKFVDTVTTSASGAVSGLVK